METNPVRMSDTMVLWVCKNIPSGSTILELGSGEGSKILHDNGYTMYSVEHSLDWLNKYDGINYVYAPITEHKPVKGFEPQCSWYDKDAISRIPKGYKCIIVDGPPDRIGRSGFYKYLSLFDTDVPIIVDDLNRGLDYKLALRVSAKLKRPLIVWDAWNPNKQWGVI